MCRLELCTEWTRRLYVASYALLQLMASYSYIVFQSKDEGCLVSKNIQTEQVVNNKG